MTTFATPASALAAYVAVRDRLPSVRPGEGYATVQSVAEIAGPFEVVLLDSYGVLNVGDSPVPGAAERVADLRKAGKHVMVITNSAGYPKRALMDRYSRLGFDFAPDEVASSREALLARISEEPGHLWGLMLSPRYRTEELEHLRTEFLTDDPATYERADGFLLIGSDGWSERRQDMLEAALRDKPRPVLVGNPDLVAPREGGLTLEPGHFAHLLADRTGVLPEFFGKPFRSVFDIALSRLPSPSRPERVLMVGDTLHTDVLGAKSMGFAAALVTRHGSLAGADIPQAIAAAGIVPDFVAKEL